MEDCRRYTIPSRNAKINTATSSAWHKSNWTIQITTDLAGDNDEGINKHIKKHSDWQGM